VISISYLLASPFVGSLQFVVAALVLVGYLIATLIRLAIGLLVISATIPFLGMLRRILFQNSPVQFDFLLLIVPLYLIIMLVVIGMSYREQLRVLLRESLTTRLLLLLLVILTLQIFNPAQGGLSVGIAGALFYIVPLLWFFVGRVFLNEQTIKYILATFLATNILAALYGLMQTFVGFPEYDAYWLQQATKGAYTSLFVGGTVRAIGPFTSSQEYAVFLSCGLICLLALALFRVQPLALAPAALLGVALFLESSRGPIITSAAIVVVLLALRQRSKTLALGVIGLTLLVGVVFYQGIGGTQYAADPSSTVGIQELLAHQVNGLTHPFDLKYSTGQLHYQQILNAFLTSFRYPIGYGLGSTTIAASKFGAINQGAELDIPDIFLSGGVLAGIIYVIILYRTLKAGAILTFRYKVLTDIMPWAAIAITLGQTLNGGLYSLMPFLWLFVAWIDRRAVDVLAPEKSIPRRWRRLRTPLAMEQVGIR